MVKQIFLILAGPFLALGLAGCGTHYATMQNPRGEEVMLLGYDPVAYFTEGKPTRGKRDITSALAGRTYYFASTENKRAFDAEPQKYEPQYGGFCSNGAPYRIKLGSDPTEFVIHNHRLFIFGDVLGREMWLLQRDENIVHADREWPMIAALGWRQASLLAFASKVPWYRSGAQLSAEYERRHGKPRPNYDPGGMVTNLFFKSPGWRAAEGFGQPALGGPD